MFAMVALLLLSDVAPAAAVAPDTTLNPPTISHTYLGQPSYDYNISAMYDPASTTIRYWWCGGGLNPHQGNYIADVIYHQSFNFTTHAAVGTTPVLTSGAPGTWDDYLLCNPTVVGGYFTPFGDGQFYAFAMYYVALGDVEGWGLGYNRIGAAFSKDGITWRRYHDPIWAHPRPTSPPCDANGFLGIGSPSAVNTNAAGGIRLFYHDNCNYTLWSVSSTDGLHFGSPTQVTTTGLGECHNAGLPPQSALPTTANFAWEAATNTWYLTADLGCQNNQRPNERGTLGWTMFRMPGQVNASLGSGTWEPLLRVDTNMTGGEVNSFPALLRNFYGTVDLTGVSPQKIIYFTTGNPRVPTNATVQQGVDHAEPNGYWDIASVGWNPNASHLAELRRYQGATHNVTTGYNDPAFFPNYEGNLGWLYNTPQPSLGATRAIYNCHVPGTANYFNSLDPLCEGQRIIGLNGYAFPGIAAGRRPLYRCQAPGQHFVSNQSNCEGQVTEFLMGYAAGTSTG